MAALRNNGWFSSFPAIWELENPWLLGVEASMKQITATNY